MSSVSGIERVRHCWRVTAVDPVLRECSFASQLVKSQRKNDNGGEPHVIQHLLSHFDSNSTFEIVRQRGTELSRRTRWRTTGNNVYELSSGKNLPKFTKRSESATVFFGVGTRLVFNFNFATENFWQLQKWFVFNFWSKNHAAVEEIPGQGRSVKEFLENSHPVIEISRFLSRRGSARPILSRVKALARKIMTKTQQKSNITLSTRQSSTNYARKKLRTQHAQQRISLSATLSWHFGNSVATRS